MNFSMTCVERDFKPEEMAEVTIHLTLDEPAEVELQVGFVCQIASRGDDFTGSAPTLQRKRLRLEAGSHDLPFSIQAPPGPFDFRGRLFDIGWSLVSEARTSGADEVLRAEVPVSLTYGPMTRSTPRFPPEAPLDVFAHAESVARAKKKRVAATLIILALGFALLAASAHIASAFFGVLICVAALVGLHIWARGRRIPARELPDCEIELHPAVVGPGGLVTIAVELVASRPIVVLSVAGDITMKERARFWRSTGQSGPFQRQYYTKDEERLRARLTFDREAAELDAGDRDTWTSSIRLPSDAPITMSFGTNEIVWQLEIRVQTNLGWKRLLRQIYVLPTADAGDRNPIAREPTG